MIPKVKVLVSWMTSNWFPTKENGELLLMRVGRAEFKQSQISDMPKMYKNWTPHLQFCSTKVADTIKRENVRHVAKDDDFAFTIQPGSRDMPKVDIESGSTCNFVDRETWKELKKKKISCKSWKSRRKLYSYCSEDPINTAGEFEAEIYYKDRHCSVVAEEKARAILSQQTPGVFDILKIEISSVSENLLGEFEGIFNGVGKLKDFQANLLSGESVQRIAQKLRPSPFWTEREG